MKKTWLIIPFFLIIVSSCERDDLDQWSFVLTPDSTISDIFTSNNGQNYVTGRRGFGKSGRALIYKITSEGSTQWVYETEWNPSDLYFDEVEEKIVVLKASSDSISVSEINSAGIHKNIFEVLNKYEVSNEAQIIKFGSSYVLSWRNYISQNGEIEYTNYFISIDTNGSFNWIREIKTNRSNSRPELFIYGHQLYFAYNSKSGQGYIKNRMAKLNKSGEIVEDFALNTNLDNWEYDEYLWTIDVNEDEIYINASKRTGGSLRVSRISKYTINGLLTSEVEIPFVNDFHITDNYIWAIGRGLEHDADLGQGYPYLLKLDKSLKVILQSNFATFVTATLATQIVSSKSGAIVGCMFLNGTGVTEYDLFVAHVNEYGSL